MERKEENGIRLAPPTCSLNHQWKVRGWRPAPNTNECWWKGSGSSIVSIGLRVSIWPCACSRKSSYRVYSHRRRVGTAMANHRGIWTRQRGLNVVVFVYSVEVKVHCTINIAARRERLKDVDGDWKEGGHGRSMIQASCAAANRSKIFSTTRGPRHAAEIVCPHIDHDAAVGEEQLPPGTAITCQSLMVQTRNYTKDSTHRNPNNFSLDHLLPLSLSLDFWCGTPDPSIGPRLID